MTFPQAVTQWVAADTHLKDARHRALTALRAYRGRVRVRELARRVGCSAGTISAVLQGDAVIAPATAAKIADHLPHCLKEHGR